MQYSPPMEIGIFLSPLAQCLTPTDTDRTAGERERERERERS